MLRYFFFVVISSVTFITAYGSDCEVQHFEDHSVGIYCRGATLKKGEMLSVDENITEKEIVSLHLGNCNGELEGYIIPNMELVTSISLADCDLKKLILPDLPKLTYVQVTNSAIPKLNKDTWKNVKQLPSIHLDGNHVEIEENAFTDLHSLKKLSVSHEKVPLSKNFLQGLDKLEELYLNDIGIKAIDVNTFDNTPDNTIEEVHLNSAFDKELQDRSINSNFLQEDLPSKFNNVFPRCHSSNPFLVEQYNLTKRAIATRYRPVNGRAFNSNPRQKPYEDFTVNEMLTGGLYRIANSASEKLNTPPQENRFSEIPQKAVNSRAPKKNQFVPHENY